RDQYVMDVVRYVTDLDDLWHNPRIAPMGAICTHRSHGCSCCASPLAESRHSSSRPTAGTRIRGTSGLGSIRVLPRHHDPAREVDQYGRAEAEDRCHSQQDAQNRGVHPEEPGPATAHPGEHFVAAAAAEPPDIRAILRIGHGSIVMRYERQHIGEHPGMIPESRPRTGTVRLGRAGRG